MNTPYPTEREIRTALMARVSAYCKAEGIKPRTFFARAINDPGFFGKLKRGENFTLRTYQRVHRYLDQHAPRTGTGTGKRRRNGGS